MLIDVASANVVEVYQLIVGAVHPARPAPGTIAASKDVKWTDELAVMVDTFRPLLLTKQAMELDDANYPLSWLE